MSEIVAQQKSKFVENVQKWVTLDNQMKMINEKMKKARHLKNELLNEITKYASEHDLENKKIEITDGELRFYEKKEYQPITFSYVEGCLEDLIEDKRQIEFIMNYLREHRNISVSKDIRRNYKNRSSSFS